jgi:hypothetical protein
MKSLAKNMCLFQVGPLLKTVRHAKKLYSETHTNLTKRPVYNESSLAKYFFLIKSALLLNSN